MQDIVKNGRDLFNYLEEVIRLGYKTTYNINNYNNILLYEFQFKYEDYITNPINSINEIYNYVNLDINCIQKFKIQYRKYIGDQKNLNSVGKKYWYDPKELNQLFKKDINSKAIARLSDHDKREFLSIANETMQFFGYHV